MRPYGNAYCQTCADVDLRADRLRRIEAIRPEIEARIAGLEKMRADHVRDWYKPWPGMEFCKALFGMSLDAEIADLRKKIAP